MSENPKVFVSHASEDKERFVLDFAKKLRSVGIDAWLDKWEMLPGDSLVDKIFEEGIKEADSFIVVLSINSINKPWVREELNTAIVKRISDKTKIIPIVLDNVEVPECLKSTLYEPIKDVNNYDKEFDRIKNSILGVYNKPALGTLPQYSKSIITTYTGLTNIDSIVLSCACEIAINDKDDNGITFDELLKAVSRFDVNENDTYESVDYLSRKGYFEPTRVLSGDIPFFMITTYGMDLYIKNHYKNINEIEKTILLGIVNHKGNKQIASENEIPLLVVNHIFEKLKQRRLIEYSKVLSGDIIVFDISPELKRILYNS